jgi:hypothetical protein
MIAGVSLKKPLKWQKLHMVHGIFHDLNAALSVVIKEVPSKCQSIFEYSFLKKETGY